MTADGVSGEVRPAPVDLDVPRLRPAGTGLAGIASTGRMTHHEHLEAVRRGDLGSVHSWELVTSVDGPGTRLTVFVAGCGLRCQYCHNPDTFVMARGEPVLLEDLVARLRRYRGVFQATHGGLTVSGGEPLMQPAFVGRLFHEARAMGIHTCLDTNGYLGANAPDALLDDVDLVLLDIKAGRPDTYREVTGVELKPTLRFSRRLAERGQAMWIRYVLVPGLTDAVPEVEAVAAHVATLGSVERVEVLPFHQMGRDKWESLGLTYRLADTPTPTAALLDRVRGQFRAYGLTTY
ncbi:pyruvate formate-lyase-activating protein [Arsenicicoccus dermatophilus]|uniref:pyruvate formate-lyase-activating protein n=1 Tax=Arsenicicoccus dermatophilus TaxID=1076331 RepID=UPI003916D056